MIKHCPIGFTKKARTTDHMFILKCIIDKYCHNAGGKLYVCFVDFCKAFDSVIHPGLNLKLLKMNVGSLYYNIVSKMYRASRIAIKLGDSLSDEIPVMRGVRQGDSLSPNLFKIFINDLPDYLEETSDPVTLNTSNVHCLMYADDIVLMSTSAAGLQEKLDCLDTYCADWCLDVNTTKTKIMIFNKAGRVIKHEFMYKGMCINCVQCYKYLGTHFSLSGSFTIAKREMYKKALKAYHKLRKDFLSIDPSIRTSIHIFDHTIKPILLYGSDIWSSFSKSSFSRNITDINKLFRDLPCDKLHLKFCKLILGVHKKSTNFAVLSELGRLPLHFNIVQSLLNYWYRLENLNDNEFPLLREAFKCSKDLHEHDQLSWYSTLNKILKVFNINDDASGLSSYKFKQLTRMHIRTKYLTDWEHQRSTLQDGKLRTYFIFKEKFCKEKYLETVKKCEYRKAISKFRISAHKLQIELGRYSKPITPKELRICKRCSSNVVDDEMHFLLECHKLAIERGALYKTIDSNNPRFSSMSNVYKFYWIMNSEDPCTLDHLGALLYTNLPG